MRFLIFVIIFSLLFTQIAPISNWFKSQLENILGLQATIPKHQVSQTTLIKKNTPGRQVIKNKTTIHDSNSLPSQPLKPYQLNLNFVNLSVEPQFSTTLIRKLDWVFTTYKKMLRTKNTPTVELNLNFVLGRVEYENQLFNNGLSPVGNIGIYSSRTNQAIIEFKDYSQAINVAVHEAVHAINYAYFGRTHRFINEGLAEYFEDVDPSSGMVDKYTLKTWLKNHAGNEQPTDFSSLVYSDIDWHSSKTGRLYANSQAWFHFLMSNQQGHQAVMHIMKTEAANRHSVIPRGDIFILLTEKYENVEIEFGHWFEALH
ncbi:DUF1570 domain-containing protein [Paraglaciecola sp.]|uniref:DUF1570 domain-containing protein n=1 Tax=Paraglaciecola sp. TaxID=1920173 RepID=UPI003EF8AA7F